MKRFILLMLTVALMALAWLPSASAAPKPTTPSLTADEQLLMQSINKDYAYDLTYRLSTMPYPYLGEVVSGTSTDLPTAQYLRDEMLELGLTKVRIEDFGLVGWNFGDALVEVTSPVDAKLTHVRSIDGCPPTPGGRPVSGEVVDAGYGRRQDFAAIPGGVVGKIVLIQRTMDMFYGVPAIWEAKNQGAKAVLLYTPVEPASLNQDCAHAALPGLYITGADATYLKGLIAETESPVQVSVTSDVDIDESAEGHAVYGFIEGSTYPDEYVVFEAHYDHWWAGANDDNSGIGSSLGIAKAMIDSGLKPKRSMVFMFFSGHESATGGSLDSHWDWATGPYFFFRDLHPEWAPRVVEALVADDVGEVSDYYAVETTPDLAAFLKQAVKDSNVNALQTTYVFTPVSSFDSWSYYWAGTPAMTTYQFELNAILDMLGYHRDADYGIDRVSAEYLEADARFRGLAGWRLAKADILPHQLGAESAEVRTQLDWLGAAVNDADTQALRATITDFGKKAASHDAWAKNLKRVKPPAARAVNRRILDVLGTVSPLLWDQDLGLYNAEPGWNSITKFEHQQNDIPKLKAAVWALQKGNGSAALQALRGVITMAWGADVSSQTYHDTLGVFYTTPYLNWADGHMPWITDVHDEYDAVAAKVAAGDSDFAEEIGSLQAKTAVAYAKLNGKIADVDAAFTAGAALLP